MSRFARFALIFMGALAASALGDDRSYDLDVSLPPGTPLEWAREMRVATPSGRGMVPTLAPRSSDAPPPKPTPPPNGPKETSEGPQTPPPEPDEPIPPGQTVAAGLDYGAADPFAYARILTQDIVGHLRWTVPTPGTTRPDVRSTDGGDGDWSYPPLPSDTLYWFSLAAYLRRMLHPSLISEAELIEFLTELGEPALIVSSLATNEPSIADLVREVKKRVTPLPSGAPKVRQGRTTFESMVFRLATEELTSSYMFELNPYFAWRTLSLGNKAYPALVALSRDPHTFLARNATALLGGSSHSGSSAELLKLAQETKDPVVRARAVSALIRRKYFPAADLFLEMAKSDDRAARARGLYGLGMLGDPKHAGTVLAVADRHQKDSDVLWAAVPALARMAPDRKDVKDFLASLRKRIEDGWPDVFGDENAKMRPDAPDPPGTRAVVIWQMTLLAQARMGDKDALDEVHKVIKQGPEFVKKDPNPRVPVRRAQPSILDQFLVPTRYLLLETLAKAGGRGHDVLRELVETDAEDPVLQLTALFLMTGPKAEDPKYLEMLARSSARAASVRALALQLLHPADPKSAATVAQRIVEDFADSPPDQPPVPFQPVDPKIAGRSFLCVTAMKIAGAEGRNDPEVLLKIMDRMYKEIELEKKAPKPPQDPDPLRRYYGQNSSVVVKAPVLETAIHELGRTGSAKGLQRIIDALKDTDPRTGRAEAALALGNLKAADKDGKARKALLAALEDKSGWVRWCASRALNAWTGREVECDWLYGSAGSRNEAVKSWRSLIGG